MGWHSAKKVSVMPCQKCQEGTEETSPEKEEVLVAEKEEEEKGRKKTTLGIVLLGNFKSFQVRGWHRSEERMGSSRIKIFCQIDQK